MPPGVVAVRVPEPARFPPAPTESREPFLEAILPVRPAMARLLLFIPIFDPLPCYCPSREPLDLR